MANIGKSPYELMLEEEISILKSKLAYYESVISSGSSLTTIFDPPGRYDVYDGPVRFHIAGSAKFEQEGYGWHFYSKCGNLGVNYYISDERLCNDYLASKTLADMHEKLIYDLAYYLRNNQ